MAGWSKPVKGIAKALVILQVLSLLSALALLLVSFSLSDSAKDFHNGVSTAFDDDIGAFFAAVGISGLLGLAAIVLLIVWSFRIAWNIRQRDPSLVWKPGLTIVAWLLSGCTLGILPFLMLREHWKKSAPLESRNEPVSPLVVVWFVLTLGQVATGVAAAGVQGVNGSGLGQDTDDVAKRLSDQIGFSIGSGVLSIASTVVLILIIRQLTERHARLTGEA
jgi:ABC-type Fe3+ transport system permease subunit